MSKALMKFKIIIMKRIYLFSGLGYIVGSKGAELAGSWQWGLRNILQRIKMHLKKCPL